MAGMNARPALHLVVTLVVALAATFLDLVPVSAAEGRRPASAKEMAYWLGVARRLDFTDEQTADALGMSVDEIRAAAKLPNAPTPPTDELAILPYPGGRHPRIGFLDGAIDPQRETKFAYFPPWPEGGYFVVDLPEAIWFEPAGEPQLLYLAHTHIPTFWSAAGVRLPQLEWTREPSGALSLRRDFPNGAGYSATATPRDDFIEMTLAIHNAGDETLTGLRAQVCIMLAGATGFEEQTGERRVFHRGYAAAGDRSGERWVIVGFRPLYRAWANAPCPCVHADPQFPDCSPGETVTALGRAWCYEGADVTGEIDRRDAAWAEQE